MADIAATDPDRPCLHMNFDVHTAIARVEPDDHGMPKAFVAEIKITCGDCQEPFRFSGLPAGLSYQKPMVGVDELELRAPIRPASADPDFGMGIPGFAVKAVFP